MTKDEDLITDPPLKALTVFAIPMMCVSSCLCRTYECFYLHSTRCRCRRWCACKPLFWCSRLREDENNRFYFFNKFFAFKRISRHFWILHFSLDDEYTANACGYNKRCGAVLTYLFCWLSVFIYV